MSDKIRVAGRIIGAGQPCFIIAEAGVNHNGDIKVARQLVDAAVAAGADAVKFQTFKADRLVATSASKADYQIVNTDSNESQLEMLRKLELTQAMHRQIMDYCRLKGVMFLSTPFDRDSVDYLDGLGVPLFKLPSGEINNAGFLVHVARKNKPLIVSTGMSDLEEVKAAEQAISEVGNKEVVFLHCVSNYPADPADANLRAMQAMSKALSRPVGYSDHTLGIEVSLAAVAMGACVIEKHFTLDKNLPGPDHKASLEPSELKALVKGVRTVEAALGHGRKQRMASEMSTAAVARKSLVAARDIAAGTLITKEHVAVKRPGTGLPPYMEAEIIGRITKKHIAFDSLFLMDMFNEEN
ncbi:N-acetylneuraminate synthase [Elusimicrobiota bacterium]